MSTLGLHEARLRVRRLSWHCLPPPIYFAAGALAAAIATVLAGPHNPTSVPALRADPVAAHSTVRRVAWTELHPDRTGKADRLVTPKPASGGLPLAAVEVVGAENVSIRFRSRFGQVVFQTDPLTATTYIAKDLAWPPFVIRSSPSSPVEQRFFEPVHPPARRPAGCEPVTSDVADPAGTGIIGRCIAMADRTG